MTGRSLARAIPLSDDGPSRTPPTEFQIWSFGKIRTVKGTFLFDARAAKSVMSSWRDWGNRLTFDYEHGAVTGTEPGHGKSAGSCLLELRRDGLWAVDVRWTPRADAELSNAEWLYFSPAFLSDPKSGRILSLINIALTNVPATKGMKPLVAADTKGRKMNAKILSLLAAITAAMTALDELDAADGDGDSDEMKKAKAAKMKAAKERLAKAKLEYESAVREHAAFGGDGDGDADDAPPSSKPAPGKDAKEDLDACDTAEEMAKEAPQACARVAALAQKITGKKKVAEVLGALEALRTLRDEQPDVATLTAEVAQLRKKVEKGETASLLESADKAGKLTPRRRENALSMFANHGIGAMRSYLDGLEKVEVTTPETKKKAEASVITSADGLSKAEREMCSRMAPSGTSVEEYTKQYLAQKKANAARIASLREAGGEDTEA